MAIKRKSYCISFNKKILDFSYGKVLMKELGMKYRPDEPFYKWLMRQMHGWGATGFLEKSFKIHGKENLKNGNYQLFLFNHELRHDPFVIEGAVTLASGIGTPIPAPALPKYILERSFSPIIQKLYSYPIYSKKDGDIIFEGKKISKKEMSLAYSEYCLFHYGRLLVFPTGELSKDGKQIKGISYNKKDEDGNSYDEVVKGRLGSAEILWRLYHHLHETDFWKKGKRIQVIPGYVSYYPLDFLRNPLDFFKNIEKGKVRVRFGKSLDNLFQEEVIDEFYSFKNRIKTFRNNEKKEELKKELQIKFMGNVMDEIGNLVTINMAHLGSRIIYDFAEKKVPFVNKNHLLKKIKKLAGKLKDSDFYLSEHFDNDERIERRYDFFLKRCEDKGFFVKKDSSLELNYSKILDEPEYKNIRRDNRILYNSNKLGHLESYKKIEKRILKD